MLTNQLFSSSSSKFDLLKDTFSIVFSFLSLSDRQSLLDANNVLRHSAMVQRLMERQCQKDFPKSLVRYQYKNKETKSQVIDHVQLYSQFAQREYTDQKQQPLPQKSIKLFHYVKQGLLEKIKSEKYTYADFTNVVDFNNYTAAYWAFTMNHKQFLNEIYSTHVNAFPKDDNFPQSCVEPAIRCYQDITTLKALVDKIPAKECTVEFAYIMLRIAASSCHVEAVNYLVEIIDQKYGKQRFKESEGLNIAINCAAQGGNLGILKSLIELNPMYESSTVQYCTKAKTTALLEAVKHGHSDSVKYLLHLTRGCGKQSFYINKQEPSSHYADRSDKSALHYAVINGDQESYDVLLQYHADKTLKDCSGKIPMDYHPTKCDPGVALINAEKKEEYKEVERLLAQGVPVYASSDREGNNIFSFSDILIYGKKASGSLNCLHINVKKANLERLTYFINKCSPEHLDSFINPNTIYTPLYHAVIGACQCIADDIHKSVSSPEELKSEEVRLGNLLKIIEFLILKGAKVTSAINQIFNHHDFQGRQKRGELDGIKNHIAQCLAQVEKSSSPSSPCSP